LGGGEDKLIHLWSMPDGQEVKTLPNSAGAKGYNLAISPSGKIIAFGYYSDPVFMLAFPGGEELPPLSTHFGTLQAVDFSPDGALLAAVGSSGNILVFSLADGKTVHTMKGLPGGYSAVKFSLDGKILFTAGLNDGLVELWSLQDGAQVQSIQAHSAPVTSLALDPHGARLYSASQDQTIQVWTLPEGQRIACLLDIVANARETKGTQYRGKNAAGEAVTYTLPCGSPIPAGAVCTCNCVSGSACSCVGDTRPSGSGGSHYWHPN
jgi:WD40 repeat protein